MTLFNDYFLELLKLIVVLFLVVIGNIVSGITNNVFNKEEAFDFSKLVTGIIKAITACLSLIIIAYIFTIVDLSNLGFEPKTVIMSGIIVYTGKLLVNAMALLGLSKDGKVVNGSDLLSGNSDDNNFDEDDINQAVDKYLRDLDLEKNTDNSSVEEDNPFEEVILDDEDKKENNEGPEAVG